MEPPELKFDHFDTFYLANTLTKVQLGREAHRAEMKAARANTFIGTEDQAEVDLFPWADYAICCQTAIKYQQTYKHTQPAGFYEHVDTDAVKSKNDILTIVERYTKLRKAGKNFTGRCPIHQDKHPSLMVYPEQQSWHCFGCNRGGDVIEFIKIMENADFRKAIAILN